MSATRHLGNGTSQMPKPPNEQTNDDELSRFVKNRSVSGQHSKPMPSLWDLGFDGDPLTGTEVPG
jgi:hypothetical protein